MNPADAAADRLRNTLLQIEKEFQARQLRPAASIEMMPGVRLHWGRVNGDGWHLYVTSPHELPMVFQLLANLSLSACAVVAHKLPELHAEIAQASVTSKATTEHAARAAQNFLADLQDES